MMLPARFSGMLLVALVMQAVGCKTMQFGKAGVAPAILEAQAGGIASGAGGTLQGPANSAAPSTQVATRRTVYVPPDLIGVRYGQSRPAPAPTPAVKSAVESPLTPPPAPSQPIAPSVAWTEERTETTIGQHQDAAGIVKMAATLGGWSTLRWMGALCLAVCIGGLLWSHGNPDGYPLVFWKVGGCGVFFLLCSDNPSWLLLLLLPLGFYAVQKFNLLKIP